MNTYTFILFIVPDGATTIIRAQGHTADEAFVRAREDMGLTRDECEFIVGYEGTPKLAQLSKECPVNYAPQTFFGEALT